MSITWHETPQSDELRNLANAEWRAALADVLGAEQELDADEPEAPAYAEPVSFVLPYRAAYERYTTHVKGCCNCTSSPIWDLSCETGAELAHLAADAMAMQEEKAALN